jgi:hypothetical protein
VPDASHQAQSGPEVPDAAGKSNTSPDTGGSIVPEKGEPNGVGVRAVEKILIVLLIICRLE